MLKKIHHVGIVVRSLDEAYRFYRDTLGLHVHKEATVEDQGVKAALLTIGNSEIELGRYDLFPAPEGEPRRPDRVRPTLGWSLKWDWRKRSTTLRSR
jgi:catechol 2,3-dioxygenase-like lactoylglutathione lyase family enzyme